MSSDMRSIPDPKIYYNRHFYPVNWLHLSYSSFQSIIYRHINYVQAKCHDNWFNTLQYCCIKNSMVPITMLRN